MTSEELAAIRARADAATEAYFDHLAPRCSHAFVGEGLNCGLSSGHDGPHSRLTPANDGWRYVNEARQDVPALLDEVARLTAEVERLSAMAPRWGYTHRGRMWRLYCCGVRLLDSGLSAFPGELVLDTTTGDEYPDLPTACASVCARLGLHDIKPPTENT